MKNHNEIRKERHSKNKGLWYSIGLHTIIVALVFLPFINIEKEPKAEFEDRVVVDFSTASSLTGASANEASAKTEEKVNKKTKPVKKVEPSAPEKVLTQNESEVSVPDVKKPEKKEVEEKEKDTQDSKTQTSDKKEVNEVPETKPTPVPVKNDKEEKGSGSDKSDGPLKGNADDKSTGSGKADTGEGKSDKGVGEDNKGNGLFGDIGELSRPVVDRPNVSNMIRENSIVKVRICISRSGRVVDFAYEPEGSQVEDRQTVNETLGIISKYRFERVVGGPKLECGIFTVKVKMGN